MAKNHVASGEVQKLLERLGERFGSRQCPRCKTVTHSTTAMYCIICAGKLLQQKGEPDMLYKGIRLNSKCKAVICPHCDNEEVTPGDYCMICGSNIINKCSDTYDAKKKTTSRSCGTLLTGNARFCPQCGNESSFYQQGWLKDWRSENTKRAIENINTAVDFSEIHKEKQAKTTDTVNQL